GDLRVDRVDSVLERDDLGFFEHLESPALVGWVVVDADLRALGQIVHVLDVVREQREGFEVDRLEGGDLVALPLDLGVEIRLVLEVVRVDVAVRQRLVRQRVVRVFGDLDVESGILGEVLIDEIEDVTLRHRGRADDQFRDVAVLLADTVGPAADEPAAGQQQGGTGRNGDEFGLHYSPLMCSLCCVRQAASREETPAEPTQRWSSMRARRSPMNWMIVTMRTRTMMQAIIVSPW